MADYVLSVAAENDLTEIYHYTFHQFGVAKADAYLLALEERFQQLAAQPLLGRKVDHIREGYFRYNHGSHAIFYILQGTAILIVRVLHGRMDIGDHL